MGFLRIAQAQINVVVGDLVGNLDKITRWIERARDSGADIVTFPELSVCGYPPEDLLIKTGFLNDNRSALERLAGRCRGITVVVGFAHRTDGDVHNAAAVIHDKEITGVYRKIELPNYGVFDEMRYFRPGSDCLVFEIGGVRFSITICEDIWIPGSITEDFAVGNGVDIVLNISASPFHAGKPALRQEIVSRFARATGTTVFFNNLVGGQDELVFDGGSLVIDARGNLVARAARFEEQLLVTDLDTDRVTQRPGPGESAEKMEPPLLLEAMGPRDRRRASPTIAPEPGRLEEIYKALILGCRDYVLKNGFKKVVLGMSGGIDSALTAVCAVEALGAENVVGVTMPSQYTSDETFSDAELISRNLNIELITVPVREIFRGYLDVMGETLGGGPSGVTEENLQARIRGNILMALSNEFGWLVLGTGNKSETAVGYCTLYGDMVGGFAVVKDVPKTVVYELADYVNEKGGSEIIPRSVIERPPTAELKPDQKDEDSLPPYETLDPILLAYVEQDKAPDEIVAEGFDPQVVEEVVRMVDRNEYKRRQASPGVKITPKAFGKDRRLPLTNRYVPRTTIR